MAFVFLLLKVRPIRWALALVWTAFISILLVQPEQQPLIATGIPPGPITLEREIFFTTLHLIAFAMTCALWFWAWFGHLTLKKSLLLGVIVAIILGSVTEYLQTYAPDRHPSLIDLVANCAGALWIAYIIWRKQDDIDLLRRNL